MKKNILYVLLLLTIYSEQIVYADAEITTNVAVDSTTKTGCVTSNALHHAVAKGDIEAVRSLLANGADPNQKDAFGWTALGIAVEGAFIGKNFNIAKILLENGADPNQPIDLNGWTVLFRAAQQAQSHVVELLLAHGAIPDKKDAFGWTALSISIAAARTNCALLGSEAVVIGSYSEVVKLLLANGADPNQRINNPHWTIADGSIARNLTWPIKYILTSTKNCPYYYDTGHVLLTDAQVDFEGLGMSVWRLAIAQNQLETADILLKYGAFAY